MLLSQRSLDAIQRYCTGNRPLLERAASAGCFCCGESFSPSEIREWTAAHEDEGVLDETAKCPKCGRESVLPSSAPIMMNPALLKALRDYWFKGVH